MLKINSYLRQNPPKIGVSFYKQTTSINDFDYVYTKNRYYGFNTKCKVKQTVNINKKGGLAIFGLNVKDKKLRRIFFSDCYDT